MRPHAVGKSSAGEKLRLASSCPAQRLVHCRLLGCLPHLSSHVTPLLHSQRSLGVVWLDMDWLAKRERHFLWSQRSLRCYRCLAAPSPLGASPFDCHPVGLRGCRAEEGRPHGSEERMVEDGLGVLVACILVRIGSCRCAGGRSKRWLKRVGAWAMLHEVGGLWRVAFHVLVSV